MPTVGPTLPPHLQKRKRSPSDPEDPTSPPSKIRAASPPHVLGPAAPPQNPDELHVQDESSEDDYGPSIQASKPRGSSPPKRVLGPAPPPAKNPAELDLQDDSSEDDYGPSAIQNKAAPAPNPATAAKPILGPAPPPANLSEKPTHSPNDSDSSSDDDYGPSLPPAPGSAAAALLQQRAQRDQERMRSEARAEPTKPQRAEWMLAPPTDSDWTSRVDPTKLKNRKFASGKGAKAPAEKSGVSAIWTETPEEKRQRLEDEVLGRKDKGDSSSSKSRGKGDSREDREAEETARRIRDYNERNRNKSLMDEFQGGTAGGGKEKEDDPSKRGFDREKDMALGGRLGHGEKREMLAKAKDFGSRFQKGRYL
jgi:hypothetical protein